MTMDFSNIGNYSLPTKDYNLDTSWLNSLGDSTSSTGGFNLSNIPWGNIFSKLGKTGVGTGTGLATISNESKPDYILKTQWLGNGLANTGLINQYDKKQKELDKILGSGDFLSSLFKGGMGGTGTFMNDLRNSYDEIMSQPMYSRAYGDINYDYSLPTTVDYNQYRPNWL